MSVEHIEPKRILCYGVCGSGKTTLARRIGEATGIPWHSADDLAWLPGWVMTSTEWQAEKIAAIVEQDEWVLDTAYGKWIDVTLGRVELIVALDYPRWFSFGRLLKRTVSRAIDKKPICNGNTETWRQMFSRDSILVWHCRSFKRKRERIRAWEADPDVSVFVFRSARAAEDWVRSLSQAG
jgi:adenylate kinase family enzyme